LQRARRSRSSAHTANVARAHAGEDGEITPSGRPLFQPLGEKQHVSVGDAMFARDGQIRKGRPPVR
jgi:hypothetical protein